MFPERISRIESLFQQEISRLLELHAETIQRSLRGTLLTVTRVAVSKNLERAVVYYSCADVSENQKTDSEMELLANEALAQVSHYIISHLRQRVTLKRFPKMMFAHDKGLESADRVYRILEGLKDKKR